MLKDWMTQIDKNTESFNSLTNGLTNEKLNWKPDAKTWSIAQNIDHIIITNESYYPVLQEARNGSIRLPFIAKFKIIVDFLGKFILKGVNADRKKKIKTFPVWEPDKSNYSEDILEKFQNHQTELKNLIKTSKDLLEKGTIISSPANKLIVYKLETAFDIIITHEQRHLEQIKEVIKLNNRKN